MLNDEVLHSKSDLVSSQRLENDKLLEGVQLSVPVPR